MHKAIQLKVTFWIEDIEDPERDFAPTPAQVVQTLIQSGAHTHPELQITLKWVTEDSLADSDAALTEADAKPADATQVNARIWLEGEDEPAHDFAQTAIAALQEVLQHGSSSEPAMQIIIKAVVEDNADADESEDLPPITLTKAPPIPWLMRLKRWFASFWGK